MDARSATTRSRAAKISNSRASRAQPPKTKATKARAVNATAVSATGLHLEAAYGTGLRTANTGTSKSKGLEATARGGASLSGGALSPINIDEDNAVNLTADVTTLNTRSHDMENLDPALFANPLLVPETSDTNHFSSRIFQTDYLSTDLIGSQAGSIGQVLSANAEIDQLVSENHTQSEQSPEQSNLDSLFEEEPSDEEEAIHLLLCEEAGAPSPGQSDLESLFEEEPSDEEEAIHLLLCEEAGAPSPKQSDLDSLFEEEEILDEATSNYLFSSEVTKAETNQETYVAIQPEVLHVSQAPLCNSSNMAVVPDGCQLRSAPPTDAFELSPPHELEIFNLADFNYAGNGSHSIDPTLFTTNENFNALEELGLFIPAELNYAAFGAPPVNPPPSFTTQYGNTPASNQSALLDFSSFDNAQLNQQAFQTPIIDAASANQFSADYMRFGDLQHDFDPFWDAGADDKDAWWMGNSPS